MNPRKQRVVFLIAAATALVVVALAGVALRRPLASGWRSRQQRAIEDPFLRSLESGDETEKRAAAARLGELKSERAIRPLVAMLRSWGKATPAFTGMLEIHYTVPALTAIGPPAGPALREALRDENELVRANAGHALEKMGAAAVPELAAVLAAGDLAVDARANAGLALGRLGPAAREAVPALAGVLEDPGLREAAVHALVAIGPQGAEALRAALPALPAEARAAASRALGQAEPAAGTE